MTFYNIIFGILFLASCRQVLMFSNSASVWTAGTIAILIFNDAVNTSHVLEGATHRPYRLPMKLLDLLAFLILSLAMISLKPNDTPFGVEAPEPLASWLKPARVVWILLFIYWVLAYVWNWIAGLYSSGQWPKWARAVSAIPAIAFAITAAIVWHNEPADDSSRGEGILSFSCLAVYFIIFKCILYQLRCVGARSKEV